MMWIVKVLLGLVLAQTSYCSNESFNASLRDYSVKEEPVVSNIIEVLAPGQVAVELTAAPCSQNVTAVRTLQTQSRKYVNFAPLRGPIKVKRMPDNYIAGSNHARGIISDHPVYVPDYDEGANFGYAPAPAVPYHAPAHHDIDFGPDFHLSHHHHKHYDPGLTAKAILLPVAGLAILGAAAALVSNPVLLQLGVVSGRRRREVTDTTQPSLDNADVLLSAFNRTPSKKVTRYQANRAEQKSLESSKRGDKKRKSTSHDSRVYVPIPIKIRDRVGNKML